jgi:hypothetical protein
MHQKCVADYSAWGGQCWPVKMAVFWVVVSCSLVEVTSVSDILAALVMWYDCLHHLILLHSSWDDGGSRDLWNVGKLIPDYMALQSRRQPSLYLLLWKPQILQCWPMFGFLSFYNDNLRVVKNYFFVSASVCCLFHSISFLNQIQKWR